MSHTTSAPSIPITVATNGVHDNKDYDGLYESVMNFSTKLSDDKGKTGKDNSHTALSKSSSVLVNSAVQNDPVKVSGSHRNSFHGDSDLKVSRNSIDKENHHDKGLENTETAPVAPKRPIRKKKSLRTKEDLSRTSSNSSQCTDRSRSDSGVKMPMEYFSDSSEMSPRDSPGREERKYKGGDVKTNGVTKDLSKEVKSKPDVGLEKGDELDSSKFDVNKNLKKDSKSSLIMPVNAPVEESSLGMGDLNNNAETSHGIIMDIRKGGNNTTKDHCGIVELDKEEQKKPLEVQTVEFDTQTRDFKSGDFSKLCEEENKTQKVVDDLVSRKVKPGDGLVQSALLGEAAGQKLSSSLESLEDIDKILKEQVSLILNRAIVVFLVLFRLVCCSKLLCMFIQTKL